MCGRYTLAASPQALVEQFDLSGDLPDLAPSYNVAPGTDVPAVVGDGEERRLGLLRWGLVPFWADDPEVGSRIINARAESAPEKPSFRAAFRQRRCLIPADGFYEWQRADGGKQPFYARMENGEPFAFAGLWERWRGEGEEILSCTILTTDANALLEDVHHRMPVIVAPENYGPWLDPASGKEDLTPLLKPYPDELMETYPVGRIVNNPKNDDPSCIEAVG